MLDQRFLFALSEDEKWALCELAWQDRVSQSAWLRARVQEEARARGLLALGGGAGGAAGGQQTEVGHGNNGQ